MSASSFEISRSTDAVFSCEGPLVTVYFKCEGELVGRTFTFSRGEAAKFGTNIKTTGIWDEFPVSGISIDAVKAFGGRLRDYGLNGC
jgi:hypothetical protein